MAATDTDPVLVELYNMVLGDTWPGIAGIGPVTFQAPGDPAPSAPTTTLVSARLFFVLEGEVNPSIRIGSEVGMAAPITITNAVNWSLTVPPIAPDVFLKRKGVYYGHFEVTDDAGTVYTLYRIKQELLRDYTIP